MTYVVLDNFDLLKTVITETADSRQQKWPVA